MVLSLWNLSGQFFIGRSMPLWYGSFPAKQRYWNNMIDINSRLLFATLFTKRCVYIYIVRYIYRSVSYIYSTVSLDLLSDLSRDRHRDISSVSWLRLIYFDSSIEIPPVEFYKIVSKWMTYL